MKGDMIYVLEELMFGEQCSSNKYMGGDSASNFSGVSGWEG